MKEWIFLLGKISKNAYVFFRLYVEAVETISEVKFYFEESKKETKNEEN